MRIISIRQNATLMRTMDALERDFASIKATVEGHFAAFDQQTSVMWENMTAESFHQLKSMIASSHTTVGGILCGLSVKMGAWHDKFGGREAGLIG